jgi:hypothetical protein
MRFPTILLSLAGALALAGCDPSLISLAPAVSAQDAVFDSTLLGTWEAATGGDHFIFERGKGNAYTVTMVSDGNSRQFDALLFQAGEARLLDLSPRQSDDSFQVPGHALIRILASDTSLRWTYLDSDWLRQQAARELPNRARDNDGMLLTAETGPLYGFLTRYAGDDRAHGDVEEWQRPQ